MPNSYQSIIDLLRRGFAENSNRKVKAKYLIEAASALMAQDDTCRQAVLQDIQKTGKRMAGNQQVLLRSLLFFLARSDDSIKAVAVLLPNYLDDLECYHYLVWMLRTSLFTFGGSLLPETGIELREKYIRPTYLQSVHSVLDHIHSDPPEKLSSGVKKIGIVLSQFLSDLHAPSRLALIIATGLTKLYNVEVHIINSNLLPTTMPLDYFYGTLPNSNSVFIGTQKASYDDAEFGRQVFYLKSFESRAFDFDSLIEFWTELESENYDALINLGDVLYATDFFYNKIPILSFPLVNQLPVAPADQVVLAKKTLSDQEQEIVQSCFSHGAILDFHFNVATEGNTQNISQADFDIPEDAFVFVVVGNRLEYEIDMSFLSMVKTILDANPKAYVLFVASVEAAVRKIIEPLQIDYGKRCKTIPFQNNLIKFFGICDVYLNPKRNGGGTSAQLAINSKVPVLTLDFGDCTIYIPAAYRLSSYAEMESLAMELSLNSETLNLWKEIMQKLSDTSQNGEDNIRILYSALSNLHQAAIAHQTHPQ